MNPGSKSLLLDVQAVAPGTRLELKDGSVVEITENPGDGIWLFCRAISNPDGAVPLPGDRPLFPDEVAGYAE